MPAECRTISNGKLHEYSMTIKCGSTRFMDMVFYKYLSLLLFAVLLVSGKGYAQIDSYENYEWRIKQQYLYDTYIPASPSEAYAELEMKTAEQALQKFAAYPEDSIRGRLQLTLGKWMAKNWQLHEGSRLSHYFSELGLSHPDDMVEFLILGFHRDLNGVEVKKGELIDRLVKRRKSKYFQSQKGVKRQVISIDTIQREPPK